MAKVLSRRLPDAELVSAHEIARAAGVSARTLERMIKAGSFPAPLALTRQTRRWPRHVVAKALGLVEGEGAA